MVQIKYIISKEEDISNWIKFINYPTTYGVDRLKDYSEEFKTKVVNKSKEEQIKVIIQTIEPYYSKEHIYLFKIKLKNKIKKNKLEIIKRLEKIHSKKFPVEYIICKYTTFGCCPYQYRENKNWFGIFFSKQILEQNLELLVFVHELMHLFFHYYFWDYCENKGLTPTEIQDLKESVTTIVNYEFNNIIEIKDDGYPIHQRLIQKIKEIWAKNKNFENLVKEMCDYILNRPKLV